MSTSERLLSSRRKTAVLAVLLGGGLVALAALPVSAGEDNNQRDRGHEREEHSQGPPRGQAPAPPARAPAPQLAPRAQAPQAPQPVQLQGPPRGEQRQGFQPNPSPEQRGDARQGFRPGPSPAAEQRPDARVGPPGFVDPRRMQEQPGGYRGGNPSAGNAPRYGNPVVGPPRGNAGPTARIQPPSLAFNARRPPPPERIVPRLDPGYHAYNWGGEQYYHQGGRWYRPWGGSYLIVSAPFGMFVPYLPGYYTTFWYGGSRYYMADDTYYLYDQDRRGYVVASSPYGDDQQLYDDDADSGDSPSSGDRRDAELYVYPTRGQSEQQQADDKYECHRWAADQVHYDPTNEPYRADDRAQYDRAMTACLTGRGYSVK